MCPQDLSATDSTLSYLFPIDSEKPFEQPKVSFLDSGVAAKCFAEQIETWDHAATRIGLVRTMLNFGIMGTFVGMVWETVVQKKMHDAMQQGGLQLQYREMHRASTTFLLTTPQAWQKLQPSDTQKGNLQFDTLYEPPPNFAKETGRIVETGGSDFVAASSHQGTDP